jgi:4-hydroxyphenylpyruvate dioxygenase
MGPFPHDAEPAEISAANPAGTDGFEFVEFAHPEPPVLAELLETMGFTLVARHKSRAIGVYRQGDVNYLVNAEPNSHAMRFVAKHGPCAPSMAWRVADAEHAFNHAVANGSEPATLPAHEKSIDAPAIVGIGGSLIYFIDAHRQGRSPYDAEFDWVTLRDPKPEGGGLLYIDHLTHNVLRGNMDKWADFYAKLFNFKQIRYFDIEGKLTGLFSRAMTSPCGKIRIPVNESADDSSQIEEFLRSYKGEGIQHIACGCRNVYDTVIRLRDNGLPFMPPPPASYYQRIDARLPGHAEPLDLMRQTGILIDGEGVDTGAETRVLLQIFSGAVLGPIFFEFIQRKGDDGFGEGNFRALFESIEEDQIRRGVLAAAE